MVDWQGQFANFVDLKLVAHKFGFVNAGLARITEKVLGVSLPKSIRITRSDWACAKLSRRQRVYAALDAFVAGQVFRTFRQWHEKRET